MAKTITGTPITYGSIDKSSNNPTGVIAIEIIDDSTGSDVTKFKGEMYASEVRVSYEADTNQATDMLGEVISHCTYNQRKILNLTGVVLSNNHPSSFPVGITSTIAKANLMFSAPFSAGMRLNVNYADWREVNSEPTPPVSENNLATQTLGLGNYTIQSAEKTRSSGNYAEWTISAIEYLSVAHGGNDTTTD
jgi:hypothetical protein